jgi:hypothetical protein
MREKRWRRHELTAGDSDQRLVLSRRAGTPLLASTEDAGTTHRLQRAAPLAEQSQRGGITPALGIRDSAPACRTGRFALRSGAIRLPTAAVISFAHDLLAHRVRMQILAGDGDGSTMRGMPIQWPDTSRGPCPTVMLRHELPGGQWHVDWMIARDPDGQRPLLSFRLGRSLLDLAPDEAIAVVPIQDHRAAYLEYEGPISGDRGRVSRIAAGRVLAVRSAQETEMVQLDIEWRDRGGKSETITIEVAPAINQKDYRVKRLAIRRPMRYK